VNEQQGSPDEQPIHDRVGSEEAMGTEPREAATDAVAGPAGAPERLGKPAYREAPAGGRPVSPRPAMAAGWDEAVDLEKDPATIPDPAEVDVPEGLRSEVEAHMAKYPDRRSAVIPALHAAQAVHGWCSPEAIRQVAAVMRVTPAYLSSVASFYDMLNEEPVGRNHVYVCTSVACMTRHAKRVYEAIADAGGDLADTEIRQFECLGACDMAPMASVNGRYIGPLAEADAPEIAAAIREGREPLPGRGLGDEGYHLPWERPPKPAADAGIAEGATGDGQGGSDGSH
jgi:NADH-quinone oxidoreductase subunit E